MELADLTGLFNQKVSGKTAEQLSVQLVYELEKQMGLASQLVNPMIKVVYETMAEIDGGDVRIDGVNHLLEYPEYANVEKLKDLLGLFEEKENLLDLIPSTSEEDGINVFIGRENGLDVMAESSLIFKTIKQGDKVVGAIGVIGPRRMDYAKVFGIINQLSDNIHHVINAKLPPPKKENL